MKKRLHIIILINLLVFCTMIMAKQSSYALIISVGDYSDESILDIKKASEDANELKETFLKLGICEPNEIKVLENPSLMQLTVEMERWARKDVQNLILYYTGHGFGEENDNGSDSYILAADSYSGDLEFSSLNITEFLRKKIDDNFKAKNTFLFIDSCYSGGITADLSLKNLSFKKVGFEKLHEDNNFQFILSSGKDETSLLREDGGGHFTYYLIEGLNGSANQSGNGDEFIQIDELGDYIRKQVVYHTEDKQHPQTYTKDNIIFSEDLEGKFKKIQNDIFNAYMNDKIDKDVYYELLEFFKKKSHTNEYDLTIKGYLETFYKQKDLEGLGAKVKNLMGQYKTTKDIQIITDPEKSEVFFDGVLIGHTPLIIEVTDESHHLKIEKKGYKSKSMTINFNSIDDELIVELEKEAEGVCYLTLSVGNDLCLGAEVFIDGEKVGVMEENGILIQDISIGEHLLTVDSPLMKKHEEILLFRNANELLKTTIFAEKVFRTVLLFTNPLGSIVSIDGELLQEKTPLTKDLEVGKSYDLKFEKYGYVTQNVELDISEKGTPFKEEITLEKNKPPLPPSKIHPTPSDEIKKSVKLQWICQDREGDQLQYDIFVGKNGNLREIISDTDETIYQLEALEYDTSYSWQIVAKDEYSQTKSPIWTFKTEKAPTLCQLNLKMGVEKPFDVYINDRLFNDQDSFSLTEGDYKITVKKIGYENFTQIESISWNDVERGSKTIGIVMKKAPVFVEITAEQKNSTVLINDVYAGKTPYHAKLEWGSDYTLSIVKEGYFEEEKEITFNAKSVDKAANFQFNLKKIPTTLKISSNEPDTKIFVDGHYENMAPLSKEILWGKEYKISAEKEGFIPLHETIFLKDFKKEFEHQFELEKEQVRLQISTIPDTADIYINKKFISHGYADTNLEWGQKIAINLKNKGYFDKTQLVSILNGDIEDGKSLTVKMEKIPIKVTIDANIQGAEVLLDSLSIGYTPLTIEQMWGNTYKIEIKEPGYESYQEELILEEYAEFKNINARLYKTKILTHIDSDPQGATVYIDNEEIGKTPLEHALPWGTHQIVFEKYGYSDIKKQLDIQINETKDIKTISQPLEKKKATIRIDTYPSGSEIFIDDVKAGVAPLEVNLYPGKYKILIQKDMYKTISDELKISVPDVYKEQEKSYAFEKKEIEFEIRSTPDEAEVILNNTYKGTTPLILSAPWGKYNLLLKKKGFYDLKDTLSIEKNITIEKTLEKRPISLYISSTPSDAIVYIDNIQKGNTPLKVELSSGDHIVMVKKEGFEAVTKTFSFDDSMGGSSQRTSFELTEKTAWVNLNVNIPDAWVRLDGLNLGKYNFSVDAGVYWLEVGKDGYSKFARRLYLNPADTFTENIVLSELDTTVEFIDPIGADIFIDGRQMGWAPKTFDIEAGEHLIVLRKTGVKLVNQKILVKKGDQILVNANGLQIKKSVSLNTETVSINSNPSEAEVYINGEYAGNTPLNTEMEVGKYVIQLKKEGYHPSEPEFIYVENSQGVTINKTLSEISGYEEKITVTPINTEKGTLKFTEPKGMSIYVDNTFKGWVPMDIKVTSGTHSISIEDGKKKLLEQRVTVRANEIFTVQYVDNTIQAPEGMVYVSKGSYITGNDTYDNGADKDEMPSHKVTLSYDYFMDKDEITNAEYCFFMNDMEIRSDGTYKGTHLININTSGSRISRKNNVYYVQEGYENHPIVNVTWLGCVYYANWLSERNGLASAYDKDGKLLNSSLKNLKGFRLPTEAEWEFAAFSAGNDDMLYAGGDNIDKVAVYIKNSNKETKAISSKDPNNIGLYDMSGNVSEYCQDVYDYYPEKDVSDWFVTGTGSNIKHVVKGGDYKSNAPDCRIKDRDFLSQRSTLKTVGFRLVRTR